MKEAPEHGKPVFIEIRIYKRNFKRLSGSGYLSLKLAQVVSCAWGGLLRTLGEKESGRRGGMGAGSLRIPERKKELHPKQCAADGVLVIGRLRRAR